MCNIPETRIHGTYPLERLPDGWRNAEVVIRRSNGVSVTRRIEILELSTMTRYPQEPLIRIAVKCFGLFLIVQPLYFFIYTIVHFFRLFLVPIVNFSPFALFKEAWKIVQIPFFYTGMEFAALYGIVSPLEGRAVLNYLEQGLHDGKGRREAVQYERVERSYLEYFQEALFEEDPQHAFFVGFCMQSLGSRNDDHVISADPLPDPVSV
jgi:hypothetical protein